jgi:hypothetical protein
MRLEHCCLTFVTKVPPGARNSTARARASTTNTLYRQYRQGGGSTSGVEGQTTAGQADNIGSVRTSHTVAFTKPRVSYAMSNQSVSVPPKQCTPVLPHPLHSTSTLASTQPVACLLPQPPHPQPQTSPRTCVYASLLHAPPTFGAPSCSTTSNRLPAASFLKSWRHCAVVMSLMYDLHKYSNTAWHSHDPDEIAQTVQTNSPTTCSKSSGIAQSKGSVRECASQRVLSHAAKS